MALLHAKAGESASGDRPYARDGVDGDDLPVGVFEVEVVVFIEELGEVEEVEPPDGIGETFGDAEGPESACRLESSAKRAKKPRESWAAALPARVGSRLIWVWVAPRRRRL